MTTAKRRQTYGFFITRGDTMTSIALSGITTKTERNSTPRLLPLVRRLAAWRRYRNYPGSKRARERAIWLWVEAVTRHSIARI
jgi:hypothetical protein